MNEKGRVIFDVNLSWYRSLVFNPRNTTTSFKRLEEATDPFFFFFRGDMAGADKEKSTGNGGGDKSDAFYLGSNDNPGNLITPVQLKGENYDEWAMAIRTALRAKRKLGFLEGTVPKPKEDAKRDDWYTVHSMLVAWLLNTIEPSIRSTLMYYEDAQELWTVLKVRFCVVNGTRICQLKASLADYKQGKTESVASYFGRISKIWDDLATYVKLPACTCTGCSCGGCKCGLASQYQQLVQEDRLQWFLVGVDGGYASARSQLLNQDPLPSLDRAYQILTQEERLRGEDFTRHREDRDTMMAMKVQSDLRAKSKAHDNSDKFCAHCNRDGHDESSCFQLHGFPEWWGDRPRGGRGPGRGGRGGGRSGASGSRGRGGASSSSWKSDQPTVRANKTTAGSASQLGGAQAHPRTSEQAGLANITPEQWKNILEILNLPKPNDRLNGPSDEAGDWSG